MPEEAYDFEYEMMYMGMDDGVGVPQYPRYMYKDGFDPLMVNDTDEEVQGRANGYDTITASAMANRHLINWAWDLEDMSPKQLAVFAKEEYGVDLPSRASQGTLFKAVTELARFAPQNRNRLVLMAHTIEMKLEATQEEIRRMVAMDGQGLECETITEEFWA